MELCPTVFFKWCNEVGWPVEYASDNVIQMFGYSKEEFLDRTVHYDQLIHEEDLPRVLDEVIQASNSFQDDLHHLPYRIMTRNGEIRWVEDRTKIERDANGKVLFYYGSITEISPLENSAVKLQETLSHLQQTGKEAETYRRILDSSYIVSTADAGGNITSVNDYLVELSGYSREELIGKPHNILRHPSVPKELYEEMWKTILSKRTWHGMVRNRTKNGKSYFVDMTIVPILGENGEIKEFVAVRHDVTKLVKQQEQIKSIAFRSICTGLPNLYAMVRDIERESFPVLALINIDGFKVLNNLYGYKTGDKIIKEVTRLLIAAMAGAGYRLYHIHADEFGVLSDGGERESFIDMLLEFQKSLHVNGLHIHGKTIPLHVSIAYSQEEKENLLVSCNMAMHYARSEHERFVMFDERVDFSKDYQDNLQWTAVLHEAINDDLIEPFFQPIYDLKNDCIQKFEALIRIRKHDEVFSPSLFLGIAKKVKLYPEISSIMLEKTFDVVQNSPYTFSINLSVEDIMCSVYTKRLFKLLAKPREGNVILEIVESEGIENFEAMNRFVEEAKQHGCKIAIDDFGTGYSNFEYLLKLNADYIKLDGSLIKNIDTDRDAEDIVSTIVSFAKKKNIAVIAEMVANEAVLEKVRQLGIEYAQGYFIGRPSVTLETGTPPKLNIPVSGKIVQMVYVSRVAENLQYDDAKKILDRSWHNNRVQGISGVLVYDGTFFIQCLEGDPSIIKSCFERISKDRRHHDICLIAVESRVERKFQDWTMSHVGYHVYATLIPKYLQNGIFDPYLLKRDILLELLDEIHKVA